MFKKSLLSLALVACASSAFANSTVSDQEIAAAFGATDLKTTTVVQLSQAEMEQTKGAFWPAFVYIYAPTVLGVAVNAHNSAAYMPLYHSAQFVQWMANEGGRAIRESWLQSHMNHCYQTYNRMWC
jgi:hypothetical protein